MSLPAKGVEAVSLLVNEHLASRHKLVVLSKRFREERGLFARDGSQEVTLWLRRLQIMLHS